jgi:hypothetical protein
LALNLALTRQQRRQLRIDRRTWALGAAALGTTGALLFGEVARVWKRGSAPLPTEVEAPVEIVEAAEEAARETVEVAVSGYKSGSTRENALLNLLGSFTLTFGITRLVTFLIRRRGRFGPIRNYALGERHIHHFVPGIALAFLAGGASVVSRNEELDPLFAVPFGVGVALTLDESALLLELDDVYWTERGIVSVQITLGALALVSSVALALRVLRRGERQVLEEEFPPMASATWTE